MDLRQEKYLRKVITYIFFNLKLEYHWWQLFVGGFMSNLCHVFVSYSGVQYTLCSVFVLFFFILCTMCCQFLWIGHFWLPLRYSLTFICQFLWIGHFLLSLRYSLTFISWNINAKRHDIHQFFKSQTFSNFFFSFGSYEIDCIHNSWGCL